VSADLRAQLQRTLGDSYTLEHELGGGGMSRVFVAREVSLDRLVVVKVLSPELAAAVSQERFRREIQFAARLQHPHIVPVLATGSSEGLPFYTMPFQAGESLRERLARDGPLPVRDATAILRDVAQALAYAHTHGIVHRDIKPENILLTGGVAMVTDFGVAKAISLSGSAQSLTSVGIALGTPMYMAPEQGTGDPASDQRADLYALGAVAYEMLCGKQLFPGRSAQKVLVAHAVEMPTPVSECRPDCPPALAALVMKCLEKDPSARPASATEVLSSLDAVSSGGAPPITVSRRKRPSAMLLAAIAVVAALIVGAVVVAQRRAPSADTERSIAVLPFENASGEQESEYFGDGMAEELINGLSKVPNLRVAARTSAFAFRGKNTDVRTIGKNLNVATILEGSVRKAGTRIRVSARLVDATDGNLLWSDEYQREMTDVFGVQDELARAIVAALQLHLSPGGATELSRRGTTNVEAYNLYLRGRYFFERRSRDDFMTSVKYFSDAIAADSSYAAPYSGLADAYALLTTFGYFAPNELMPKAKVAALKGVALDSLSAEAHTSLGFIYNLYDWDYAKADAEYTRALQIDPRYANAHLFRAWYYMTVSKPDLAIAQARKGLAVDPLSLILNSRLGLMLLLDGQTQAAIEQDKRTLELDPNYGIAYSALARAQFAAGDCPAALQSAHHASERVGPWEGAVLGFFAARCGDRPLAERELATQLAKVSRKEYVPADLIAKLYAGLGEKEHAIDWLERAYVDRVWAMTILQLDPMYDNLREEPRFKALMRKVHAE
jgi:serine/threonine-protein kinase